jgi:anti-anti-sigma factor
MVEVAEGWRLETESAGEWLIVRIGRDGDGAASEPALASSIWALAERQERSRLIVELDGAVPLTSLLVGQLLLLHKRAHLAGGALRLCSLAPANERVLQLMGLAERLPSFPNREAALAGGPFHKPR